MGCFYDVIQETAKSACAEIEGTRNGKEMGVLKVRFFGKFSRSMFFFSMVLIIAVILKFKCVFFLKLGS